MTDFTNLAALVAQGQSLLDLVKGGHITQLEADSAAKLGEVDKALALKIAQANTAIANATAPIESKIPLFKVSKNQPLVVSLGSVPDDFLVSSGVSVTVVASMVRDPNARDGAQLALLSGMESDIKEQFVDFDIRSNGYWGDGFNVVRIAWDFTGGFSESAWVARLVDLDGSFQISCLTDLTFASFLKLESGSIVDSFATGAELGKWRFCAEYRNQSIFGGYHENGIDTHSETGSVLIALPVASSGLISHPNKLFGQLSVGK
jgi:hypothetical protein